MSTKKQYLCTRKTVKFRDKHYFWQEKNVTDIKSSSAGVCNFYSAYKTLSSRCSDNWQFIQLTPQTEKKNLFLCHHSKLF